MSGGSIYNSSTPHRAVRAAYNSIESITSTGIGPNPRKLIVDLLSLLWHWGIHVGRLLTNVAQLTGSVETPSLPNNLIIIRRLTLWSKPRATYSVWQPEDIHYHQYCTLLLAAKINADKLSDLGCG